MSDEFKLPDIGEGLAEGEIVKWLVAVGDAVDEDQPLVEVMTDKATVEIPSPRAGTIEALSAAEGDVVEIGTTILVFGDAPGGAAAPAGEKAIGDATVDEGAVVTADQLEEAREVARAERQAAESVESAGANPWDAPAPPGGAVAPAARRLAADLGVDVAGVAGSGPGGLVTKDDVRAFAEGGASAVAAAPTARSEPATVAETTAAAEPAATPEAAPEPAAITEAAPAPAPVTSAPAPAAPATGAVAEERVPLRGLRRTISERMVLAKTTVPHYTYVEEVDMTEVVALRERAKPRAADKGVKLTYLPFIIRALVLALQDHPYMNASLDEEAGEIVLKRYYNIGIATATERGLMVPVVKGADARDLFELAAEISRLSAAARDGKITLDDLQDGTFTITSTGNIGGFLATPVINIPEVAILGITSIKERPVVRDGEIVIRHMLNLCRSRATTGLSTARWRRSSCAIWSRCSRIPSSSCSPRGDHERGQERRRSHHRIGPRRICRGHPRGPAGTQYGCRREGVRRRHLPEHRLHPLQGAARSHTPTRRDTAREPVRHRCGGRLGRFSPHAGAEAQDGQDADPRGRRAAA